MTLPRRTAKDDKVRRRAASKARILVVDDDERNLLALTEVLKDLAQVIQATSGQEALRHLLKGEFAVILLDVFMPGMDGYETASLIRDREQTARIPIIFLSAVNKEIEHLMRGYAMGAVDYVFKPVDPLILKSKVSVFVDLFNMRAQVEEKSLAEQQLRDANYQAELARLQIARELAVTREREATILQSVPILLYTEPAQATARQPDFVSGDFTAMTGFTFDDVRKDPHLWEKRLHPEDRERVIAALATRAETGRLSIEYRWLGADGSYKHFLDQAALVEDATGGPAQFAGTLTDVSEQRVLESRLVHAQKMDAIGQLTGGIAHDFNNLLSAVLGGLHLLERRLELGERDRNLVDQMRHAAEQGAELIRRMMAFARKQDLAPTSVSPVALCKAVSGLVEHTLGGTVQVSWACAERCRNIYADKSQLELALVNLIINARDAMPDGGMITVSVDDHEPARDRPEAELPPGRYARIRVADHGQGIPDELIGKVTEPFFTTKEAGKGTGLGLSMVAGFIQQSGGRMTIDSESGRGTTIEMILPATDESADIKAGDRLLAPRAASTRKAILLVDDDDNVRSVLGEQLRELGFQVDEAGDGRSAIEQLRKNGTYDVLLTDFAMPGMNGMDTIRSAVDEWPDLHAVLMTGYSNESSVAGTRDQVPVVRKPICLDDLLRKIS
jgi:signal transduction histidine kinase